MKKVKFSSKCVSAKDRLKACIFNLQKVQVKKNKIVETEMQIEAINAKIKQAKKVESEGLKTIEKLNKEHEESIKIYQKEGTEEIINSIASEIKKIDAEIKNETEDKKELLKIELK